MPGCKSSRSYSCSSCKEEDAYRCSCFEGRGISASAPKYFHSNSGSSPCRASEGVTLDMSATAALQTTGKADLSAIRGGVVEVDLIQWRAAITDDDPPRNAVSWMAGHRRDRRKANMSCICEVLRR